MALVTSGQFEPTQAERDFVAALIAGRPYQPRAETHPPVPAPNHARTESKATDATLKPFWPWMRRKTPAAAPPQDDRASSADHAPLRSSGEIRAELIRALIICDSARRAGLQAPAEETEIASKAGADTPIEIGPRGLEIVPELDFQDVPPIDPDLFDDIEIEADRTRRRDQETEWQRTHGANGRIRILGELDLRGVDFPKNIAIHACDFVTAEGEPAAIRITGAKFGGLSLDGSSCALLAGAEASIDGDISANHAKTSSIELRGIEIGGGLFLVGARLAGLSNNALSLNSGRVGGSVFLRNGFKSTGEINLIGAHIGGVLDCADGEFSATECPAIHGFRATINGTVQMAGAFRARGSVIFSYARLGAPLICAGAQVELVDGQSFNFHGATISGDVNLGGAAITGGKLNFDAANIEGKLILVEARLDNGDGIALGCNGTKIRDVVLLRNGFSAIGQCDFIAAELGGGFDCRNATMTRPGGTALCCNGSRIRGPVFLRDEFTAKGTVDFASAHLGGMLDCTGGEFNNPGQLAINCSGTTIDGHAFLCRGFKASGAVTFNAARIGGMLRCQGGSFSNPNGHALDCFAANFRSSVNLDFGFVAHGRVGFVEASIAGVLDCSGGEFNGGDGVALDFADSSVGHNVTLCSKFKAAGQVNFSGSTIGGNLQLQAGQFTRSRTNPVALNLYSTRIDRHLQFDTSTPERDVCRVVGNVDLRQASCLTLDDQSGDLCDWLDGELQLDGFSYQTIGDHSSKSWQTRRRWLLLQPDDHIAGKDFKPQPFEQLERVLRQMGHTNSARRVGAERELRLHKSGRLGGGSSLFRWIFQWPTGYGYQPGRALLIALAVIAFSTLIFETAYRHGEITPAEPHAALAELVTGQSGRLTGADGRTVYEAYDDVPRFNSLLYTIDTFLPLVELDQESSWKPAVNARRMEEADRRNPPSFWWTFQPVQTTGTFLLQMINGSIGLNWFKALITGLGFMLTTLIAAALSGLFRRDR
ncbi:hypothetical protein [Maricaulis sp.]|uniref:hypothetical protein n=1 Tax=Maricaulis sp. TaxID=1486257 RepID=UPI003A8CC91C